MKAGRQLLKFFPLLPLLCMGSGCVTSALWDRTTLDCWNQPADDPHLRLFETSNKNDFVVMYDEYSERNDSVHTRAYLLNQNQRRVVHRRAPVFTSTNLFHGLTIVPVFYSPLSSSVSSPCPFAVEDKGGFALHENASTNVYDLPVYNDGRGKVEKAALTPLAVTADLTIVGGFIGYFYLEGLASSDYAWYH